MNTSDLLLETLRLGNSERADVLREGWRVADVGGLRDLVTFEGCALWLYRRLLQIEVGAEDTVDSGFFNWLARVARHTVAQNEMVYQHSEQVVRLLNEQGVPNVLLKGTALKLATDGLPFSTARATSDVDVLVSESDASRMEEHLIGLGYDYSAPAELTPKDHYHIRPLANESGVSVELHFSTNKALPYEAAWKRLTDDANVLERKGTRYKIPSATELFWHGTTHAVFHGSNAFRLRFFLDAASILATDSTPNWSVINPRLDSAEVPGRSRTLGWLGAAAWLAEAELPAEVVGDVPPFPLQRALRWRLHVLRKLRLGGRMAEKLLDEGTRAEAGMPLTPVVKRRAWPVRVRRKSAALAARVAYLGWRSTRSR